MGIRSGGETLILYRDDDQAVCLFYKPLVHVLVCWSMAVSVNLLDYAMGRIKFTFDWSREVSDT